MADNAALLVDEVLPQEPTRQWVLSFPWPLRYLLANEPALLSKVLGIVYRTLATHIIKKAGFRTPIFILSSSMEHGRKIAMANGVFTASRHPQPQN